MNTLLAIVSKTSHCAMNDDTFFMNQTAMDDPNVIVLMNVSGNTQTETE